MAGYETYWDGSACVQALSYSQACSNNYSCQTLTQGTTCNGAICSCTSIQFFNISSSKCEPLVSINGICTQANSCDGLKGLVCSVNNLCQCNSTQFWSTNICVNMHSYNQGTCTANDQCLESLGLICKLSGLTSCNCPTSVSNNKCDCPQTVNGIEYYWSGTNCSLAKSFNQTCTSSTECLTIQNTQCSGGICTCSSSCMWNSTACVCCGNGWTYHRGSCFKPSPCGSGGGGCSGTVSCTGGCGSNCNSNCGCCSSFNAMNVSNICYSSTYPTARLAILQNDDALFSSFVSTFASDLWFDAQRFWAGSSWSTTYNSFYTPGYSIEFNSSFWESSVSGGCATFYQGSSTLAFRFHSCTGINKRALCEYIFV